MKPSFELSARARLRPLVEADAKELYELIEENRSHLQPWLPWAAEQTLDRTTEFIRGAIKQEADDDGFQVALVVDGGSPASSATTRSTARTGSRRSATGSRRNTREEA